MNFLGGLIIGLIVGWVAEWIIDWYFWRRDDDNIREQLAESQTKALELQQQREQLEEELAASQLTMNELEAKLVTGAEPDVPDLAEAKMVAGTESDLAVLVEPEFAVGADADLTGLVEVELEPDTGVDPDLAVLVEPDLAVMARTDLTGVVESELGIIAEPDLAGLVEIEPEPAGELTADLTAEIDVGPVGEVEVEPVGEVEADLTAEIGVEPADEIEAELVGRAGPELASKFETELTDEVEVEPIGEVEPAAEPIQVRDQLERINGIGPAFAKKLNAGGIYSFTDLANSTPERVREVINPQDWQKIEPELWIGQAAGLAGVSSETVEIAEDKLEQINGIGPAFAKRLNGAGIYSFADLANSTPERVREIINPQDWQKIEPELWIGQAAGLAGISVETVDTVKDKLEQIKGIGPAFAKRLNEAGIYSFAGLAASTPERVREIINPQDWQKIEPEVWIAQAAQLASSEKTGQIVKDPLEEINGIGPAFAKRLNKAGIHTFADLAASNPKRLREIINPKDWQKIELELWIAQAIRLVENSES